MWNNVLLWTGNGCKDSINSYNIVPADGDLVSVWYSVGWIRIPHTWQFRHSKSTLLSQYLLHFMHLCVFQFAHSQNYFPEESLVSTACIPWWLVTASSLIKGDVKMPSAKKEYCDHNCTCLYVRPFVTTVGHGLSDFLRDQVLFCRIIRVTG